MSIETYKFKLYPTEEQKFFKKHFKNTAGTAGINACGDGSSGGCDANCSHETTVKETRKSACNKSRRSHSLECD